MELETLHNRTPTVPWILDSLHGGWWELLLAYYQNECLNEMSRNVGHTGVWFRVIR